MEESLAIRQTIFYDWVLVSLAICDEFGQICSRSMSAFKQAILQNSTVVEIFSTTPPVSLSGSEVTIDASKFIHCPQISIEPSISTYGEHVTNDGSRLPTRQQQQQPQPATVAATAATPQLRSTRPQRPARPARVDIILPSSLAGSLSIGPPFQCVVLRKERDRVLILSHGLGPMKRAEHIFCHQIPHCNTGPQACAETWCGRKS